MPQWTYSLLLTNTTDRALKRQSYEIPFGETSNMPEIINPGETVTIKAYSPKGRAYGLEFNVIYSDVHNLNELSYGTVTLRVDVPYWKKENTTKLVLSGLYKQSGFQEMPESAHNFATTATIYI